VRALDDRQPIDLHVGYSSYLADQVFHAIVNNYQRAMPNARIKLHDRSVEQNVDALLEGKLDLAFIFHAPKPGALRGLRFFVLSSEHPRLAVSPTHPLARRRVVSLEEAAREPFIVLVPEEFPDYHYFIDAVFASTKNKPRVAEEHESVGSIISAVEAGRGVALAADRFVYSFGPRVKLLRLTPEPMTADIGLAARKGPLSAAAEKFWQCAKQAHSALTVTQGDASEQR
jgi:DNA-binding transcriptional LysR family regulator